MVAFPSSGSKLLHIEDGLPILRSFAHQEQKHNDEFAEKSPQVENNSYIDWSVYATGSGEHKNYTFLLRWTIIVLLSLILGYTVTFMDLTSLWLSDLKRGFCVNKGEEWLLSDPFVSCLPENWKQWSDIFLGARNFAATIFVNFPIYLFLSVGYSAIAFYLSKKRKPFVRQSGIPEIKLIVSGLNFYCSEYLGLQTLSYKALGLLCVVGSGLWLGKEGPLVHISCCIFNVVYEFMVGRRNQNEALRREILSLATATGISAAFSAPIGGVLFVLEYMPTFFMPTKVMWPSFVSSTLATILMMGLRGFTNGKDFLEKDFFSVEFGDFSWIFLEMIPYVLLGVAGGVYGYLFVKVNTRIFSTTLQNSLRSRLSRWTRTSPEWSGLLEIIVVLVITTVVSYPLGISKVPLSTLKDILFTECKDKNSSTDSVSARLMCLSKPSITSLKLLFCLVQGFFLTAYSYRLDLPGGILMPSLVMGALFGRFVGIISQGIQEIFGKDSLLTCTRASCLVSPSSYAVVGAASFATGVTKLRVCIVVIIFELTGAIIYVLPIMCAVLTLRLVNDWLSDESIYDSWMRKNNTNPFFAEESDLNEGKGYGLCNFTNSVSSIKNSVPLSVIEKVMMPLDRVKCIVLIPEVPYTRTSLHCFLETDNHQGYPIILTRTIPVSLGYISKYELLNKLSSIEHGSPDVKILLNIPNVPLEYRPMQLHFEKSVPAANCLRLQIYPELPIFIVHDQTPLLLVLDIFDKLHLNYMLIFKYRSHIKQHLSGYVDRYILSRLLELRFDILNYSISNDANTDGSFSPEEHELHLLATSKRPSIDFIS